MSDEFRSMRLEQWRVGGTREEMKLAIPLPKSPSGMVLQRCPTDGCQPGLFQIGQVAEALSPSEEQRRLVRRDPRTGWTTCPYCGHDDKDQAFLSEQDCEAMLRIVEWAAMQDVTDHLSDIACGLNRYSPPGGPISFELDITPKHHPRPLFFREDLLRRLTCDICGCPYGVYALALFCPDCGARNLHVHFAREVDLVQRQLAIAESQAGTNGELSYRLLANAHEDVLTAFETYLKTVYVFAVRRRLPSEEHETALKMRPNTFQNIDRTRKRYEYLSLDPFSALEENALKTLRKNVRKRHIIGHNLGMADVRYTEEGGVELPGETVSLLADDVKEFSDICRTVIIFVEEAVAELLPPGGSVENGNTDG